MESDHCQLLSVADFANVMCVSSQQQSARKKYDYRSEELARDMRLAKKAKFLDRREDALKRKNTEMEDRRMHHASIRRVWSVHSLAKCTMQC